MLNDCTVFAGIQVSCSRQATGSVVALVGCSLLGHWRPGLHLLLERLILILLLRLLWMLLLLWHLLDTPAHGAAAMLAVR